MVFSIFDLNPAELLDAFRLAPTYRDTPHHRAIVKLYHRVTQFRIDLLISSGRLFEQSQLQRRIRQLIQLTPEAEADFAAPEDIILAKLEWFRMGNYASTHQWSDVRAILLVQETTLDWSYLRQWAVTLEVSDLLERVTAGEAPPVATDIPDQSSPQQQRLLG